MKTPTTLLTLIFSLFLSLGTNVVFGQCASPVGPPAAGLPGVAFGPVHLQHANLGSGAPVLLDITDCDGDGFLDAFVPWSNVTAAPPATFFTGTVCPTGVHSIRITFVGSAGPTTWRAYGPTGLIITQVRPGGGPQVVTLTSTGPKIVRVELQGDEVCVKQVCWTCKLSVPSFFRGDFNNDGSRDLSDAIGGLNYLFVTGVEPGCLAAADSNDDGVLDVSDPTYLLAYQFTGGPPPAGGMGCSVDETEDNLSCDDNGLCPDDQPTNPTNEDLIERLTLFVGADIEAEDVSLTPVEMLGNMEGAPEYVQQALQTEDSQFLLVSVLQVQGFSQAFYEVPPVNREAYLGAEFVVVVGSRPNGGTIESYACRRCNPNTEQGGCPLKQFSYPCTDNCRGCSGSTVALEYSKCDAGSLVNVTIEVEPNSLTLTGAPTDCNSQPSAIFEDLGL